MVECCTQQIPKTNLDTNFQGISNRGYMASVKTIVLDDPNLQGISNDEYIVHMI